MLTRKESCYRAPSVNMTRRVLTLKDSRYPACVSNDTATLDAVAPSLAASLSYVTQPAFVPTLVFRRRNVFLICIVKHGSRKCIQNRLQGAIG